MGLAANILYMQFLWVGLSVFRPCPEIYLLKVGEGYGNYMIQKA
jgi:hypothetical protein